MLGKEKHGNILSMQMAKKNEEVAIDWKQIYRGKLAAVELLFAVLILKLHW